MILSLLILCALSPFTHGELFDGRFETLIDHFRPTDPRTAQFNYKVNIEHYADNGPMFFYINDAGHFTTEWIERGLMFDLAMQFGGALFTSNLRYFRDNLPTETASLEDLQYLTLDQALADISLFIYTAREHIFRDGGKVFVWGTGLGGTMAILARQKFPHLIDGAWSSNGLFLPIVFTETVYLTFSDNIREYGSIECRDWVLESFRQIEELIRSGNDESMIEEFGICRPFDINNNMDLGMFAEGLIEQISGHFERSHHFGIQTFCEAMSAIPTDPLRALGRWIRFTYNADVGNCFDYNYAARIQLTTDTRWHNPGTESGIRQFLYLKCSQFGSLRTTTGVRIFDRVTEEYRQRMCEDSFGGSYDFAQLHQIIHYLNVTHGGQYPRTTHVIYTNGYLDQWISHGITETFEPNSYFYNVRGYSRWADLSSLNTLDSIDLYNAKVLVIDAFRRWFYDV